MLKQEDKAIIQKIPEAFREQATQIIIRLNALRADSTQKRIIMRSVNGMINAYGSDAPEALGRLDTLIANKAFRLGMIGAVGNIIGQAGKTSAEAVLHLDSIISSGSYSPAMFANVALIANNSGTEVTASLASLDRIFSDHEVNRYVLEAARLGSHHAKENTGAALTCLYHILGNPNFTKLTWAFPDRFGRFVSSAVKNAPDVEHMSLRALSSLFANSSFTGSQLTPDAAKKFGKMVSSIISNTKKINVYDSLELFSVMLNNPNMASLDGRLVDVVTSLMVTADEAGKALIPRKTDIQEETFLKDYLYGGTSLPAESELYPKRRVSGKIPDSYKLGRPLPVMKRFYEEALDSIRRIISNPHLVIEDFQEGGFLAGGIVGVSKTTPAPGFGNLDLLSQIIGPSTSKDVLDVIRGMGEGGEISRRWLGCFSAIVGNANFAHEIRQKGFGKKILKIVESVGKNADASAIAGLELLFGHENFHPEMLDLMVPISEKALGGTHVAFSMLRSYLDSPNFDAKAVDAEFTGRIAWIVDTADFDKLPFILLDFRNVFMSKDFKMSMLNKDGIIPLMVEKSVPLDNLVTLLYSKDFSKGVLDLATSILRDSSAPLRGVGALFTFMERDFSQKKLSQLRDFIAAGKLDPYFGLDVFTAVTSNEWEGFDRIADDRATMKRLAKAIGALQRRGMTQRGARGISDVIINTPEPESLKRMIPMLTRIARRAGKQSDYVIGFLVRNMSMVTKEDLDALEQLLDPLCDIANAIAAQAGSPSGALEALTTVDIYRLGGKLLDSLSWLEQLSLASLSGAQGTRMIIGMINAMAEGAGDKKNKVLANVLYNINNPALKLPKNNEDARKLGAQLRKRPLPVRIIVPGRRRRVARR